MPVEEYVYDGDAVLQVTDGSGVTQAEYTSTAQGYGDLLSAYDGSAARYYEPDALGSTDALSDQSQTVTDRWAYRAFGSAVHVTGSDPTQFTWVGRLGYHADPETGLYQLGNGTRHYDPQTAQLISEDPIGFAGGDPNLYRYVRNNPVVATDPSGLRPSQRERAKAIKEHMEGCIRAGRAVYFYCCAGTDCCKHEEDLRCRLEGEKVFRDCMAKPAIVGDEEVPHEATHCLICKQLKDHMEAKIRKKKLANKQKEACASGSILIATYECEIACELNKSPLVDTRGGLDAFKKTLEEANKICKIGDWYQVTLTDEDLKDYL
jgi:RHS repeat-associated protein